VICPGSAAANAEEEGEKTLSPVAYRFETFGNGVARARAHAARQSRTAILRTPPTRGPRTERKDRSINDDPAKRVFYTEFEMKSFNFLDVLLRLIDTVIIMQSLKKYTTNKQLLYCNSILSYQCITRL